MRGTVAKRIRKQAMKQTPIPTKYKGGFVHFIKNEVKRLVWTTVKAENFRRTYKDLKRAYKLEKRSA